jgi:hypothetical protein
VRQIAFCKIEDEDSETNRQTEATKLPIKPRIK